MGGAREGHGRGEDVAWEGHEREEIQGGGVWHGMESHICTLESGDLFECNDTVSTF